MAGIDPDIISRAQEVESLLQRKEDLVASCARMTAKEMKELEYVEQLARRFLEADFSRSIPRSNEQGTTKCFRSLLEEIVGSIEQGGSPISVAEGDTEGCTLPDSNSPSLLSP
ncbi:hypothetical protein McaMca56_000103 [Microsporum canis]